MKKFSKGNEYRHVDWFTGGASYYKVKDRTDDHIIFDVFSKELDGEYKTVEEFDILTDESGNEYVLLYEYHGAECVIEA